MSESSKRHSKLLSLIFILKCLSKASVIKILVNSKIFKLSLNLSLTHLRAQIASYELKGVLSPVMLKKIFHESFENFEITRICMETCKRDWIAKVVFFIQMLPTFGGRCNCYF